MLNSTQTAAPSVSGSEPAFLEQVNEVKANFGDTPSGQFELKTQGAPRYVPTPMVTPPKAYSNQPLYSHTSLQTYAPTPMYGPKADAKGGLLESPPFTLPPGFTST